ncbi:MFS transporter [Olsenella sp. KGMB02461]|nr:MFS transporter [Olsenella sp. KGMB02461]
MSTAAPSVIFDETGNLALMALLFVFRSVPALPANAALIALENRGHKSFSILPRLELGRCVLYFPTIFFDNEVIVLISTLAWAFAESLAMPCYYSLAPVADVANKPEKSINRLLTVTNLTMLVGPAIAGTVATYLPFGTLSFISVALFAGASMFTSRFSKIVQQSFHDPSVPISESSFVPNENRDATSGRVNTKIPKMVLIYLIVDATSGFAFGSLNPLMPIIASGISEVPIALYGAFLSLLMGGQLCGNIVYELIGDLFSSNKLYFIATGFSLLAFLLFGWAPWWALCGVFLFLTGLGNSIQDVCLLTSLQTANRLSPSTRLIALRESIGSITVLCASVVIAILISLIPVNIIVTVVFIVAVATSIITWTRLSNPQSKPLT